MKVSAVALIAFILVATCAARCTMCKRNNFKSSSMRKLTSASPARGMSVVFETGSGRSLELNTQKQIKLVPAIDGIIAQIGFESVKKYAPAVGAEIVRRVHQVVRAADEGKSTGDVAYSQDPTARIIRHSVTDGIDKAVHSAIEHGPAFLNTFAKVDPAMLERAIEAASKAEDSRN